MKIEIELYGACKDFSSESIIELNLKSNSQIKDLRNALHSPMKLLQLRASTITATYMKAGHTRMEVVGPILHVTYWNKFV